MTALLRAVRKQRGFTLEKFAEQTGLTKSYLSKIERGQSTPSIAVAFTIARALGVDVERLFSDQTAEEKITVDRAQQHTSDGQRYQVLASSLLGKSMLPFVIRPTTKPNDNPHPQHTGQEFVFIHTGNIELDYGDQTIILGVGDSAYFDASVSHKFRAVGPDQAEIIVVAHVDPGSTPPPLPPI